MNKRANVKSFRKLTQSGSLIGSLSNHEDNGNKETSQICIFDNENQ